MTSVAEALRDGRARLRRSPSPVLDTELLLAHAVGRPRSWLHAWPGVRIDPAPLERFRELLSRRAVGEPIAYLLGLREFWSLAIEVTPDVLIPRPESELLIEVALEHLRTRAGSEPTVLDMGTGSGCLAVAIAHAQPNARVTAVDASGRALDVARRNADRHGMNNVTFIQGTWFRPLGRRSFDVIVSNPPYVRTNDPHLRRGDVRFEPIHALDGGLDGLDAIREIAAAAPHYLKPGGLVAIEHGYDQAQSVAALLRAEGLGEIDTRVDAAGLSRVSTARRPA